MTLDGCSVSKYCVCFSSFYVVAINSVIVLGILVCVSLSISVCMLIVSNDWLMSNATVMVFAFVCVLCSDVRNVVCNVW